MKTYRPALSNNALPLTHAIDVIDEKGRVQQIEIPGERPLTIYLDKKELKNSLVLLKFKRDVAEKDYKILSCYVYCVWRVRNECKHGRDADPFEIFKIFFNKWFISITNI